MIKQFTWKGVGKAAVAGVVVFAAQIAFDFQPETITDWQTYGIGIAGGLARAIGAAVIAVVWSEGD